VQSCLSFPFCHFFPFYDEELFLRGSYNCDNISPPMAVTPREQHSWPKMSTKSQIRKLLLVGCHVCWEVQQGILVLRIPSALCYPGSPQLLPGPLSLRQPLQASKAWTCSPHFTSCLPSFPMCRRCRCQALAASAIAVGIFFFSNLL